MNWFIWAVLSAFFAGLTALLSKVGVAHVNSNPATAIRTVVITDLCMGDCSFHNEPVRFVH